MSFSRKDGGEPERNIYVDGAYEVAWNDTDTRWEITYYGSVRFYLNGSISAPKPPTLGTEGNWVKVDQNCGDLTKFEGSGTQDPSMLPVELVFFEAKTDLRKIRLLWQTASEINNEPGQSHLIIFENIQIHYI